MVIFKVLYILQHTQNRQHVGITMEGSLLWPSGIKEGLETMSCLLTPLPLATLFVCQLLPEDGSGLSFLAVLSEPTVFSGLIATL